jgi:hypothetical protein
MTDDPERRLATYVIRKKIASLALVDYVVVERGYHNAEN